MNLILKWISAVFIASLPVIAFSASYCPSISDIHVENGYYTALTSIGKWTSVEPASSSTDFSYFSFWQARGNPIGNTAGPLVKVGKLTCWYSSSDPNNPNGAVLRSPGYPSLTVNVKRSKSITGWNLYVAGFMDCLTTDIDECPFTLARA